MLPLLRRLSSRQKKRKKLVKKKFMTNDRKVVVRGGRQSGCKHTLHFKTKKKLRLHNLLFSLWTSYCHITQICSVRLFIDSGPYEETAEGTERLFLPGRQRTADPTRTALLKIHFALVLRPVWEFI